MVFRVDYTLAPFFVTRMKRLGKTFVLTQGYPWVTRWLRVVTRHKKYVISPGHYPPLLIRYPPFPPLSMLSGSKKTHGERLDIVRNNIDIGGKGGGEQECFTWNAKCKMVIDIKNELFPRIPNEFCRPVSSCENFEKIT